MSAIFPAAATSVNPTWDARTPRQTLHELKLADGLAELLPVVHVLDGYVERCLHEPQRPTTQDEPLKVKAGHQDLRAAAHRAKYVLYSTRPM